jgi:hypothetical protein
MQGLVEAVRAVGSSTSSISAPDQVHRRREDVEPGNSGGDRRFCALAPPISTS